MISEKEQFPEINFSDFTTPDDAAKCGKICQMIDDYWRQRAAYLESRIESLLTQITGIESVVAALLSQKGTGG